MGGYVDFCQSRNAYIMGQREYVYTPYIKPIILQKKMGKNPVDQMYVSSRYSLVVEDLVASDLAEK